MPGERFAAAPKGRPWVVPVLAVVLCCWVGAYRFNTLGGAFGGFDNDHYLHFALAKQVESGEQPLRDFLDSGLQGARPSLTYELSAAAQRVFGDNLRSEAWLTVTGVALGAGAAFVAGSGLAWWPWALVTALMSALMSPKLYGYPKVLVLGVAAWLIVGYAAQPTRRRVVVLAAWTAVAFLFRHDYAVYCGVGFASVIVVTHLPRWTTAVRHAGGYAALTLVLLAPSLAWVQYYAGLGEYLRNSLEMGQREAERTDLDWPVPELAGASSLGDLLEREANTQAWIYYLFLAMPVLALVVAASGWRPGRAGPPVVPPAAMLSLGLMTFMLSHFFLRGSLEARFGDMAPPVAVLGAGLLASACGGRHRRLLARVVTGGAAVLVLAVTGLSIWTLQSVRTELLAAKLTDSPAHLVERTRRISQELVALPAALRETDGDARMGAAVYLNRCTDPDDRVLVVGYAPEALAFSERLFAGGRVSFLHGFYMDERYSRFAIAQLERHPAPIALADPEPYYRKFPLLPDYLVRHYEEAGMTSIGGRPMRVLVRKGFAGRPTGPSGLPCFRDRGPASAR